MYLFNVECLSFKKKNDLLSHISMYPSVLQGYKKGAYTPDLLQNKLTTDTQHTDLHQYQKMRSNYALM